MTPSRTERVDRLKAVEREFHVARYAIERLRIAVTDGTHNLPGGTSPRDLESSRSQLEATYLIRLWAEFETAVRSYYGWLTNDPDPRIRSIDLINSVAASRRGRALADPVRLAVHEVREYRNALVHDRDDNVLTVGLSEARRRLNLFLGGKLPERWG